MACNCIPSSIVIPPATPSCPDCLRAGSAIISCTNSVAACGTGQIDASTLGEYDSCSVAVVYQINGYDAAFDTVTINSSTGIIDFTFTSEAEPGTFPEIRFLVICPNSVYSSLGRVKVCVKPLCTNVNCDEDEECNECTGACEEIPPIINAGVD